MTPNPMLAAVLLTAGEGTRMAPLGLPKPLLDWGGQPLIAAQTHALLNAGCRPVAVVLGAHAHRVRSAVPTRADVQITTNRHWRAGRAASIRAGARAVPSTINADADAVIVASVDQPTAPAVIHQLAATLHAAPDALIAVPRYDGRNGHPPIFRAALLDELRSVTERHEGLRAVRRRHADRTIFLDMNEPLVTLNLNTPAAYQQALALHASWRASWSP